MKAVILNGLHDDNVVGEAVCEAVRSCLESAGWETEVIVLREHKIAPCVEDFGCWVKTPGACLIKDAAGEVTRAYLTGDLAVFITPVVFGGYSSELKKLFDRSICFALPDLKEIGGETHHPMRYDRTPAMFFVGIEGARESEAESIFRELVRRNALNMRPPSCGVTFASSETDSSRVAIEMLASVPDGGIR